MRERGCHDTTWQAVAHKVMGWQLRLVYAASTLLRDKNGDRKRSARA